MNLLFLLAFSVPGVVIDHVPAPTREYVGSPSIAILRSGDYVASHDLFGPGSSQLTSSVTRVFRSTDRGRTWAKAAEFSDQFWSNLFEHRGRLYLMGCTYEYGQPVIRSSRDGGRTWSEASILSETVGCHTAPMPVAEWKGRLWRTLEWHPDGPWGFFQALVASAPLNADLMSPASWTFSERLPFPANAEAGQHWLEGNAIVARDGRLLNILRVANVEKAAIVEILNPGRLEYRKMMEFPGGSKKFTIRWDNKTKKYWTLSNPVLPEFDKPGVNPAMVRNTLALMSSPDLETWTTERIVLRHPDAEKHAFQYVDWQFDGEDLVVASRTAFLDEHGGAHRAHDANFLTFHRIERFREPAK
jgi:hypothetical protein